jgi:PEP-CTERM motif-containing protein
MKRSNTLLVINTIAFAVLLLVLIPCTTICAQGITFPPTEADWENNRTLREDLRPLNVFNLATQPIIDGQISPNEWTGATSYEVRDPGTNDLLGTILSGLTESKYLYIATDWIVNNNSDPNFGGGNAWRFGTSDAQGSVNSGNSTWFEIYVQEDGAEDIVMAREAISEDTLQSGTFIAGSAYDIDAGSFFNGSNWQYELYMGEGTGLNGCILPSYHWEWQQLDPVPGDGAWVPVYDGSVHNAVPEPTTMLLLGSGLAGLFGFGRKRLFKT